ncbi:hypothetical protein BDR07DRAFT_1419272 [Suillus spraguei]|nr:hypothetical protein BDR07DRAFT_1419272 [Suillus spraguei]
MDGFDWLCNNLWNLQLYMLAEEMDLRRLSVDIFPLHSHSTLQDSSNFGTIVDKWQGAPALVIAPNFTITNRVWVYS